jgi:hypothetical protein
MNTSEWRVGVQDIHDEAAGLLNVDIVDPLRCFQLLAAAALGDYEASVLIQAVAQAGRAVKKAPPRKPTRCMCCPRVVRRISATTVFGVAYPATGNPSAALGFVFCDGCSSDHGTLVEKATAGLRRIWPDLRPVVITHPVGGVA